MHRLYRKDLPSVAAKFLRRNQAAVDAGSSPRPTWEKARKAQRMKDVVGALLAMVGRRGRCMYCEDSRGTDIDHFWPLVLFKERTFVWENLLWSCSDCNRHKATRFRVGPWGGPMLLDPTADDPWDFLYYNPHTGGITARYRGDMEDPRGKETLEAIPALGNEAVMDGRRRTSRNLVRAVRAFLDQAAIDRPTARLDLADAIRDNDAYGLVIWYFRRDGREEAPFRELRLSHPDVWEEIVTYAR